MVKVSFTVEYIEGEGYTARATNTSIFTEGDTLEELKQNIAEAILCHFDEERDFEII
jgi:predicted RNase H-like HicB family nuclease